MERLRELGERAVFGLNPDESRAARASLLQTPQLLIAHPSLTEEWLILNEVQADPDRLRQLTLVSIFRHDDEALVDGHASEARFAGVATLTLAMSDANGGSSDAWLNTTWHDSTRSFMSALEPVYRSVGIAHSLCGISITVVFNGDQVDLAPALQQAAIRNSAAVAGVDVKLINLSQGQDSAFVSKMLSRQAPDQLFLVGAGAQLDEVARVFGSARGFDRVVWAADVSVDDVVQDLRERFAAAVGVTASLQLLVARDTRKPPKTRAIPFPFLGDPSECLHLADGRKYLRDRTSGLFWTRDTAGHSEVPFKTYKKTKTHLLFEADRDDLGGKITDKHKGPVLRQIELKDLRACNNPQAHKS